MARTRPLAHPGRIGKSASSWAGAARIEELAAIQWSKAPGRRVIMRKARTRRVTGRPGSAGRPEGGAGQSCHLPIEEARMRRRCPADGRAGMRPRCRPWRRRVPTAGRLPAHPDSGRTGARHPPPSGRHALRPEHGRPSIAGGRRARRNGQGNLLFLPVLLCRDRLDTDVVQRELQRADHSLSVLHAGHGKGVRRSADAYCRSARAPIVSELLRAARKNAAGRVKDQAFHDALALQAHPGSVHERRIAPVEFMPPRRC